MSEVATIRTKDGGFCVMDPKNRLDSQTVW